MDEKKENVQRSTRSKRTLDAFDRKILAALEQDARQTYADIGRAANLSAPAVYERVKRMMANGVLAGTSARIDGALSGKPFLAFVHVDADGWGKSQRVMTLQSYPEVEEMHSVAGDTCVIMKVRTASATDLEHFLSQLYAVPGVRGTKSFIVLSTYLERGVQANITSDWPDVPLPAN